MLFMVLRSPAFNFCFQYGEVWMANRPIFSAVLTKSQHKDQEELDISAGISIFISFAVADRFTATMARMEHHVVEIRGV
jgi:hypothetical protein